MNRHLSKYGYYALVVLFFLAGMAMYWDMTAVESISEDVKLVGGSAGTFAALVGGVLLFFLPPAMDKKKLPQLLATIAFCFTLAIFFFWRVAV
jgi:peptidoglycan/LPS O-acetylase OafA/YrhL